MCVRNPLAYVAIYTKSNPELFTEIIKNQEELKNVKIKEILDSTKIINSQKQPQNLKIILTSSTIRENTKQGVTKCNNKGYKICDMIIEHLKTRKHNWLLQVQRNQIQNK